MDLSHCSPMTLPPLTPREGWHVLHLFYQIDYAQWAPLSAQERIAAKTNLAHLVQAIRSNPSTQLLTLSMVGAKADLGFMLICPDLHTVDKFAKQLALSLGAEILTPTYSWLSITELSDYGTTETEYSANLRDRDKLDPNAPEFEEKLTAFRFRVKKYAQDRLYPKLVDWPVFCFYPMSKRRNPGQNWYTLDFESRKNLMAAHARIGRSYTGRVRQLITGSTGLDDGEWGVTLFAHTTSDIKAIVYEMRFDPVSAEYAEFGEFFIGLQLPLDELFARLSL